MTIHFGAMEQLMNSSADPAARRPRWVCLPSDRYTITQIGRRVPEQTAGDTVFKAERPKRPRRPLESLEGGGMTLQRPPKKKIRIWRASAYDGSEAKLPRTLGLGGWSSCARRRAIDA
jgi:hypothetical protein